MSEKQPPEEVPNKDLPGEETPSSGSRWEDTDAVPPIESDETADGTTVYAVSEAAEPVATTEPEAPVAQDRSRWLSGKTALIGAGLGIALIAGASGFAIGSATADEGHHGRFESERRWDGRSEDGRPMPPGGDQGFDRGQRPDFGDSDQDDSSTEG